MPVMNLTTKPESASLYLTHDQQLMDHKSQRIDVLGMLVVRTEESNHFTDYWEISTVQAIHGARPA